MTAFRLETFRGAPGDFHASELLDDPEPRVVICDAAGDALVLGSSQPAELADNEACERAGVEIVRRRSGGGAVLVEPAAMVWFDVVVASDDARFAAVAADVNGSMVWLGRHIAAALATLGVSGAEVHDAPMLCTAWSRLVCFAGIGAGEVLAGGGKLVGISQRRRRSGARFQCMVHTAWHPERLIGLLRRPRPAPDELPAVAVVPFDVATALPGAVAASLSG